MAIQVIFRPVCDSPAHRGEGVPGETLPPVLISGKPKVGELCADCRGAMSFDDVTAMLTKYGRDPEDSGEAAPAKTKTATSSKALACPRCPYSVGTRGSLAAHVRSEHGVALAALETEMGHTIDGKPLTHGCDYCDLRFASGQAKAQHELNDHPKERAAAVDVTDDAAPEPTPAKATKQTAKRAPAKRRAGATKS